MFKATFKSSGSETAASTNQSNYELSSSIPWYRTWHRFLIGGACLSLGLLAVVAGGASVAYRLTHMRVDSGLINGRTVRIQAPIDGTIQDFYARPGAPVKAGQMLAMLEPLPPAEAVNQLTPPPVDQTAPVQLSSARQTLDLLTQQLQELELQYQALRKTTVTIAEENVDYSDAEVTAAIAQESAARNKYERFSALLEAGAVSEQEVEELRAAWQSSQADVKQARSEQTIATVTADALNQQTPLQTGIKDLQFRQQQLLQDIQDQTAHISTLESTFQTQQVQLDHSPASYVNTSIVPIAAPFDGVIHSTEHDTGEQVNRPTTLMSLLDCSDLWVETLVSVEQARRIDATQPVRVQLAGDNETFVGEVEFINAVNAGNLTRARSEALLPAIPANLVGQPLARVRVRIPPLPVQNEAHQFCGVGQSAELTFGTHSLIGS
ncbi:MAG: HlyD family efflux transporter periplasmic adaptor subunit [Leptolyngbya sp. SIO1D8]|nr:HlyD family efflux transporter periplasmic adaptor subunit [Leptolyngbya sp. SIO1D8]